MLKPPSLKSVPYYPVTAFVAAMALGVTVLWWSKGNIDGLIMDSRVWNRWQLWRALTSILPHADIFHLGFNLYWLWVFGTLVEREFGHWKMAAIVLLLGFGSSLAEFTVFSGGVGLSGVGYGLWGMLWVLERRDARFAGSVDRNTSNLFVVWFFLCIALTYAGIMPVANVAHGVGAITGALLGLAASSRGALKWQSAAGVALVIGLGLAGSTVLWPRFNLSGTVEAEIERAGLDALEKNQVREGVRLLERATRIRGAPARAWYNLGVGYLELGDDVSALAAFEHAAAMPDTESDFQRAARDLRARVARQKATR
jgi:membrane associated rhomboid family serine protease